MQVLYAQGGDKCIVQMQNAGRLVCIWKHIQKTLTCEIDAERIGLQD